MAKSPDDSSLFITPIAILREAIAHVPAVRYAMGVGGIAAVVAIILTWWKDEPQSAILGGLIVFGAMVVLVIFATLARTGSRVLRPLALSLAWTFLTITISVAGLFVSCAFFDRPKSLPCLLRGEGCGGPPPPPQLDVATAAAMGKTIVEGLYARRLEEVYEQLAPSVRETLPFPNFRATAIRQLAQVGEGPLRRVQRTPVQQAGFLFIAFDAEFDEASTWLEGVTFVQTPAGWKFYRIDLQPRTWSAASNARVLTEGDAGDVLNRIRQGAPLNSYSGSWIPSAGWPVFVDTVLARKGERTCDVRLESGAAALVARSVLGGCGLTPGAEIYVVGRIAMIQGDTIELEEVRFQPSTI